MLYYLRLKTADYTFCMIQRFVEPLTNPSRVAVFLLVASCLVCAPYPVSCSDDLDRGLQAAAEGRLDEAVMLWTSVIKKNPKSYAAHVNRGSAYIKTGYIFKGIMDWHRAWQLSPFFAYAVYTGDFVRQASGNPAILNYAASLELDPDLIPSVAMMGLTYLELGRPKKAVQLYRKSMDLTKNPLTKSNLGFWAVSIE